MTIADLRKLILDIENKSATRAVPSESEKCSAWTFGVEDIDGALPDNRLCARSFHDISAVNPADRPSACGLAMALMSRLPRTGDILWCQLFVDALEYGGLHGPGLRWLGIDPGRIIHVRVRALKDLAWVIEEALRCAGLSAVVGEGPTLDFTTTRRLSLACAQAAVPCLYVNLDSEKGSSAAATRWRIKAEAGTNALLSISGPPTATWSLSLARCRGGRLGKWQLYWDYETFSFYMATPVCHREVLVQPAPSGKVIAWQNAG